MTQTLEPLPNIPLLRKILSHIDAHPEEWNQKSWVTVFLPEKEDEYKALGIQVPHCGTAFCIAGHALNMTGAEIKLDKTVYFNVWGDTGEYRTGSWLTELDESGYAVEVEEAARKILGLTYEEAFELFEGENTREDIQRIAKAIALRAGEEL